MKCIVFIASTTGKNPISIEALHCQFGTNIPNFLRYEGGTGLNYLCCVDSIVDAESICKKNRYKFHRLSLIEIDPVLYTKEEPKYCLEKNKL